jgi:hypothetical protein
MFIIFIINQTKIFSQTLVKIYRFYLIINKSNQQRARHDEKQFRLEPKVRPKSKLH